MKGNFLSALVALGLCLAAGTAAADTTLPTVVVKGTTIDNFHLACTGYACASFLESLGGVRTSGFSTPVAGMGEGGGIGGIELTKLQFCNQLSSQKPDGCNAESPPSVPTYDPMWEANGCGTGGMEEIFYNFIMTSLYEEHFSGSLDAPMHTSNGQNISFLGACNQHDRCWASAGGRGHCDDVFFSSMLEACGGLGGTDYSACKGMAGLYFAAVSSDVGTENYDESVSELACAAWAYDMRRNGCT